MVGFRLLSLSSLADLTCIFLYIQYITSFIIHMTDATRKEAVSTNPVATGSGDPISGNPARSKQGTQANHPTGTTGLTPEEVQAECMDLIESYRKDRFVYATATSFLSNIITNNVSRDATSDVYTRTYQRYIDILDETKREKEKALGPEPRRSRTIEPDTTSQHTKEQEQEAGSRGKDSEAEQGKKRKSKRRHHRRRRSSSSSGSTSSDDSADDDVKQQYAPWIGSSYSYTPANESESVVSINKALTTYAKNFKVYRTSLFRAERPPFPRSQFENILKNIPIDLDIVLSGIHSFGTSTKVSTKLGGGLTLTSESVGPSKEVSSFGQWTIAWNAASQAIALVFPWRREELGIYASHIGNFSSYISDSQFDWIYTYDKSIRRYVADTNTQILTTFSHPEFLRMHTMYIVPATAGQRF
jgi:hypothetical protein